MFDHQQPLHCEDEIASANQFIVSTAFQYSLEPNDVVVIAQSVTKSAAANYIDTLKVLFVDLRDLDADTLIEQCVRSYNKTALLLAFGEAVGAAMRKWEEYRRLPIMSIWSSHPSNFDSLRTYVWAQSEFRGTVVREATRKLTEVSEIGTFSDQIFDKDEGWRIYRL